MLQVEVPGHSLDTDAAEVLDDVAQVLAYVVTGACRSVQGILPEQAPLPIAHGHGLDDGGLDVAGDGTEGWRTLLHCVERKRTMQSNLNGCELSARLLADPHPGFRSHRITPAV